MSSTASARDESLLAEATAQLLRGQPERARAMVEKLLKRTPRSRPALARFAEAAIDRGAAGLAVDATARLVAAWPKEPDCHAAHGRALALAGRMDPAIAAYRQALRLRPNDIATMANLASQLRQAGDVDAAIALLRGAIRLSPAVPQLHYNLGNALYDTGAPADAVPAYREALRLDPRSAQTHNNLGRALMALGDFAGAADRYRAAVALAPDVAEFQNNLAGALKALCRPDEAAAEYARARALRPDVAEFVYGEALARLMAGDYAPGWAAHEARFGTALLREAIRPPGSPPWRGEQVPAGTTILLLAEQGFGDTLQFCRYAPLLARTATVVLSVQRPLVRLLRTLDGVADVCPDDEPPPAHDLHAPLMSLPHLFGTTLATIPNEVPYLHASPDAVEAWRARLSSLPGLKVGLAWAGNPRYGRLDLTLVDRRRSMRLDLFAPLAAVPGVSFISLQKGHARATPETIPPGMPLHDWTDELDDFADTAALAACLDLIVTVDSAPVHLAGALGRPVWLLNRFDTCWRWLLERSDSPWYPTLRQFRQPAPGDWDSVIAAVRDALARASAEGCSGAPPAAIPG